MNITVKIDDVSLATMVDQAYSYGDESGPHDRTVGEPSLPAPLQKE